MFEETDITGEHTNTPLQHCSHSALGEKVKHPECAQSMGACCHVSAGAICKNISGLGLLHILPCDNQ